MCFPTASPISRPCPFLLHTHALEPFPPMPASMPTLGPGRPLQAQPSHSAVPSEGHSPWSHTLMSKVTRAELTGGTGAPLCLASSISGHGREPWEVGSGKAQSVSAPLTTPLSDTQQVLSKCLNVISCHLLHCSVLGLQGCKTKTHSCPQRSAVFWGISHHTGKALLYGRI